MGCFKAREIVLGLSVRCRGEWKEIYDIIEKKKKIEDEEIQEAIRNQKSSFVCITDESFPECLKNVYQPPFLLYYYGDISLLSRRRRLTAIGTRAPNSYQEKMMKKLIGETIEHFNGDLVVVSGMAIGLDGIAMKEAMHRGAPIIAVLGSGIDAPYPSENIDIYDYCRSGKGLVLSEYPGKTEPLASHFTFRNRILAATGKVCFIGGGKIRSGTSSTARQALELGRDILALPCDVSGDDLTNSLIQDGARPVLSYVDIVEAIKENS